MPRRATQVSFYMLRVVIRCAKPLPHSQSLPFTWCLLPLLVRSAPLPFDHFFLTIEHVPIFFSSPISFPTARP